MMKVASPALFALCSVVSLAAGTAWGQTPPAAPPSAEAAAPPGTDNEADDEETPSAAPGNEGDTGTLPGLAPATGGGEPTPTRGAATSASPATEGDPTEGSQSERRAPSSSKEDGGAQARAEAPQQDGPGIVEASLDYTREPVDRLAEHYLGSTSRAVRFDWRESWVTFGLTGSELIERNNFGSFKVGGLVRRAFLGFMVEGAVSYVYVVGTQSSELLGLTPYRQPSRPSRVEIDINLSYPVFEGVVTPLFDFIPPSEIVVSATAGGRYLFYPGILIGERRWQTPSTWTNTATWQGVAQSLGTAQMLPADKTLLEDDALAGMTVDPALVHTLGGITLDAYYQPGLFIGARALLNIPALQLVSGTQLGFWWELSVRAGWAF